MTDKKEDSDKGDKPEASLVQVFVSKFVEEMINPIKTPIRFIATVIFGGGR